MSAYTDEVRAKDAAHEKRQAMGATFCQFRAASLSGPPSKLFYHLTPAEREPICDEAENAAGVLWNVRPSKGAKR